MPTDAERADMLAGVERMIVSLARKAGGTADDKEDRAQELRLLAWKLTATFDPTRGAKWSSYFMAAAKRVVETERVRRLNRPEVLSDDPADWGDVPDPRSLADPDPEPDTEDELAEAVRRQLTAGFLERLTPGFASLVGAVVNDGLTAAQIAEQRGVPVKCVRANLKLAIRALAARGLTGHVATGREVAAVTGAAGGDRPRRREMSRQARGRAYERRVPAMLAALAEKPGYANRLAKLPDDTAALVGLIRTDGLTVEGAADLLGTDPAAVREEVKAAIRRLRPPAVRVKRDAAAVA